MSTEEPRDEARVTNKRAGKQVTPFHAFKTLLHCIGLLTYLYLCRIPKHMHMNFVPVCFTCRYCIAFVKLFDVVRHVQLATVHSRCAGCVFVVAAAAFCNTQFLCVRLCTFVRFSMHIWKLHGKLC